MGAIWIRWPRARSLPIHLIGFAWYVCHPRTYGDTFKEFHKDSLDGMKVHKI